MFVKLSDIHDAISFSTDSNKAFLNKRTGEIEWIGDFLNDNECEQVSLHLQDDGFLSLPSQNEIPIKQIISEFNNELPETMRSSFSSCPHNQEDYHSFILRIRQYGYEHIWNNKLDEALHSLAVCWCQQNNLTFTED